MQNVCRRIAVLNVSNCRKFGSRKTLTGSKLLEKEAETLKKALPRGAFTVAICVEGQRLSSPQFAGLMKNCENTGRSKLCFLIGGSYGLAQQMKTLADVRLSISDMTFPHHLARVIAIEQIYRCFKINEGSAYHK